MSPYDSTVASSLCLLGRLLDLSLHLSVGWVCTTDDRPTGDVPLCGWAGLSCNPEGDIESLVLSGLGLTGILPDVFGSLGSLRRIDLSNNSFVSPLPLSLASLGNVTELKLQSNRLGSEARRLTDLDSTSLFSLLSGLVGVSYLDLSDNGLSGEIPSLLCSLPLETLILTSRGKNPNQFNCLSACLTNFPDLTLVVSSNLPICGVSTAPSTAPTELVNQKSKSNLAPGLDVGSISGITIGVVLFFLLLVCCLYTYLMRYRTHRALTKYKGEESIIEKKSSFNLMSLSELQLARSVSSQGSGSGSHVSQNDRDDADSEQLSTANDEIELEFVTPNSFPGEGDVGVTIWNDELVDFDQGNLKISSKMYQPEQLFTFADSGSSSEENDNQFTFTPRSCSSDDSHSQSLHHPPTEGFLFPTVPHLVLASQLQRHGSISSMSSQSGSLHSCGTAAIPVTLARISPPSQRPELSLQKEDELPSGLFRL
jgi:hypothetical protein